MAFRMSDGLNGADMRAGYVRFHGLSFTRGVLISINDMPVPTSHFASPEIMETCIRQGSANWTPGNDATLKHIKNAHYLQRWAVRSSAERSHAPRLAAAS
jgi:hypothetical protein